MYCFGRVGNHSCLIAMETNLVLVIETRHGKTRLVRYVLFWHVLFSKRALSFSERALSSSESHLGTIGIRDVCEKLSGAPTFNSFSASG